MSRMKSDASSHRPGLFEIPRTLGLKETLFDDWERGQSADVGRSPRERGPRFEPAIWFKCHGVDDAPLVPGAIRPDDLPPETPRSGEPDQDLPVDRPRHCGRRGSGSTGYEDLKPGSLDSGASDIGEF